MPFATTRNPAYVPHQKEVFKLSRSKIELFMQCQRCFWLDARLKIKRPSSPPFNINKAIDELLKKEFDSYRAKAKPHPIMTSNKLSAIPFEHEDLNKWRANFTGVGYLDKATNLYIYGAVDDVWIDGDELIVVDYKATAKNSEVNLDSDWQIGYKRQMEIYQWLLRKNGFKVSDTGYFLYTNARMDVDEFSDQLVFNTKLIPYIGKDKWVNGVIKKMKATLDSDDLPPIGLAVMGGDCEFCMYAKARTSLTIDEISKIDAGLKKNIVSAISKL
ncbi:MAG TPA: PD-(D/E)XK nuclease family protein [Candidatus Sulfotelmatobacter sp.]|nr:PD-(D/E)XK nuclease family protein [Candidatus Sulfotelmatobacter sp.]